MLIGKISNFAIEWVITNTYDNFDYGHFRFWIDGEPIGVWEEEVVIGVLVCSALVFSKFKGMRYLPSSDCMSSVELWEHIMSYSNSNHPDEMKTALDRNYRARFLMHEIGDDPVSSICRILLIEDSVGMQHLLWKFNNSTDVRELVCGKLEVDKIIEEFIEKAKAAK